MHLLYTKLFQLGCYRKFSNMLDLFDWLQFFFIKKLSALCSFYRTWRLFKVCDLDFLFFILSRDSTMNLYGLFVWGAKIHLYNIRCDSSVYCLLYWISHRTCFLPMGKRHIECPTVAIPLEFYSVTISYCVMFYWVLFHHIRIAYMCVWRFVGVNDWQLCVCVWACVGEKCGICHAHVAKIVVIVGVLFLVSLKLLMLKHHLCYLFFWF